MNAPLEILNNLADSCGPSEDTAFWILTSAAAHVNGYNLDDGEGSTVAYWFPDPPMPEFDPARPAAAKSIP